MKKIMWIMYCSLSIFLFSCNFKPCEKVTDKDIMGYYVPCYPANKRKQYIRLMESNTFIMIYCSGNNIIENKGTWIKLNDCNVALRPNQNSEVDGVPPYWGNFGWVRGKLSMGEDRWSFQKVWRKPKLACEK